VETAPPATASLVRLFVAGRLEGEWSLSVSEGDWVEVALIKKTNSLCIEDLTDGIADDDCP
jgi:hypothetical protein